MKKKEYDEELKLLKEDNERLRGLVAEYRAEAAKSELVLCLKPAPWRSEIDLGEAGIQAEWLIVDQNEQEIGKYVIWYGGKCGLIFGKYPGTVVRAELLQNHVIMRKRSA